MDSSTRGQAVNGWIGVCTQTCLPFPPLQAQSTEICVEPSTGPLEYSPITAAIQATGSAKLSDVNENVVGLSTQALSATAFFFFLPSSRYHEGIVIMRDETLPMGK